LEQRSGHTELQAAHRWPPRRTWLAGRRPVAAGRRRAGLSVAGRGKLARRLVRGGGPRRLACRPWSGQRRCSSPAGRRRPRGARQAPVASGRSGAGDRAVLSGTTVGTVRGAFKERARPRRPRQRLAAAWRRCRARDSRGAGERRQFVEHMPGFHSNQLFSEILN